MAGCVVEFAGGSGSWVTRTYAAAKGCGATLNGEPISPSKVNQLGSAMLVGYKMGGEHDGVMRVIRWGVLCWSVTR